VTTPTFDPAAYKATTRQQWQAAAEPWHRWGPTLEEWLGEATALMLDLAGIESGGRVLDVAAGAGGQTIAAARRVGTEGSVVATDISERILEFAERRAREAGIANVATKVMDGEQLDVEPGSFDAIISRVGFIYFPDRQAAFAGMRRALRPRGRLAGVVYSTAEANGFFSIPIAIVSRRAGLAPPAPGQPGPFSFGTPGVLEQAYSQAGFVDVEVRRVSAPLRMASAAECLRFERDSFGALHQMMASLTEPERDDAWSEIEQALSRFETARGFEGSCELLVSSGSAPEA
jgi:ubiquinone/menaquinone biosynthesis C-methylase UbiE